MALALGPIAWHRRIWRLAAPAILSNLTVPLLAAVDTAVAGHLAAPAYLGGVALGGLVFSFVFWSFGFLRMGTTGLTAQAAGAGDAQALRLILWRGLIVALVLGLGLMVLQQPILGITRRLVAASDDVHEVAGLYITIRIWAAPAALGNYVILGWLLGRQAARLALLLQLVINGTNAILAITFVFALGWGVAGIAAATACADGIGLILGLVVVRGRLGSFATLPRFAELFDRQALRRLIAVNRDIFLRTLCLLAAFAYFTARGARAGDTVLAANAVLLNFQSFMAYGLDGFAQAAEALVGAAIGAADRGDYRRATQLSFGWALAAATLFSLVFALCGSVIIDLLTDLPEIRSTALRFLPWVALSPLISVWSFQLDGIFIGATRTRELRNGMVLAMGIFLLAAEVLQPVWGNHGLWAALMIFMAARAVALGAYLPRIERQMATSPAAAD